MATSRLADIIRYRTSRGEGFTSSLSGGIKDRLREKFDIRNVFNQRGLLTSLFPSLRAFRAKTSGDMGYGIGKQLSTVSLDTSTITPSLENIEINTRIAGKNLSVLPAMSRDFNVIRQNIYKLLKKRTESSEKYKASTRADMFFRKSKQREKLYEAELRRSKNNKGQYISNEPSRDEKPGMSFILKVMGIAGIGAGIYALSKLSTDGLKNTTDEMLKGINGIYDDLKEFFQKNVDDSINLAALDEKKFEGLTDIDKMKFFEAEFAKSILEGGIDANNNPYRLKYEEWMKKYGAELGENNNAKFPSLGSAKEANAEYWQKNKDKPMGQVLEEKYKSADQMVSEIAKATVQVLGQTQPPSATPQAEPGPPPAQTKPNVQVAPQVETKPSPSRPGGSSTIPSKPLSIPKLPEDRPSAAPSARVDSKDIFRGRDKSPFRVWSPGKTMSSVDYIMLHHTGGNSLSSAINSFTNDSYRGVDETWKKGVHYIIDRDGTIYKLTNSDRDVVYHVGNKPRSGFGGITNENTIGVEIVGRDSSSFTEAQKRSAASLTRQLRIRHGLSSNRIVGHGEQSENKMSSEGTDLARQLRENKKLELLPPKERAEQVGKILDLNSTQVAVLEEVFRSEKSTQILIQNNVVTTNEDYRVYNTPKDDGSFNRLVNIALG